MNSNGKARLYGSKDAAADMNRIPSVRIVCGWIITSPDEKVNRPMSAARQKFFAEISKEQAIFSNLFGFSLQIRQNLIE